MNQTLPAASINYLPEYAQFLLDHKLRDLSVEQLRMSREVKLPVLKFFASLPEEQLIEIGMKGIGEMLGSFARNETSAFIRKSLEGWTANRLPVISRDNLVAEDITLVSFIRRKIFRDFLPAYTSDLQTAIGVMEEMDKVMVELDTACIKTLNDMQQDLYMQTQALAHIGNWVWNLESKKITWSDEIFRIYELEPQRDITYDLSSFNHPDDVQLIHDQMQTSKETMLPHDFYYRIVLKDGKEKILHTKGEVRAGKDGSSYEMFGTLQDVTAQKLYEKELQEQQHFIRKITEVTPSLITAYQVRTGKYLFINPALQNLLGYHPQEAMDQGVDFFISIIHPDDLHHLLQENAKALEEANRDTGRPQEITAEFQYRMRHRNGNYKWFHTYGTVFNRDMDGQVEAVLNISMDITERMNHLVELRQKNEEITKSEERYHRMIDEVKDYAIILLGKDGTIENWNEGAKNIKGYTEAEILGRNFRVFYPKEDQERHLPESLIHQASTTGRATHEGWRVRKDGSNFWGNVTITALHNKSQEIIGFSKVTRDLTQKKIADDKLKNHARMLDKYAQRLEEKNDELERSYKELESFSYIASHDLQEPLRKIKIFLNLIQEKQTLSDASKDYFNRIISASGHMQNLIDALLSYSQTNRAEFVYEQVDLNKLLEDVKKNLSAVIEEKKATITSAVLPTLKVVRIQFEQLFSNIISNAIKYSRSDVPPHITISVDVVPFPDTLMPAHKTANCYKIAIADNGIGFDQQYSEKIFELFQRLHGKSEFPGTGIGLAICKKIVQNHNGKMEASSEPGKGAVFAIYLPAEQAS